MKRRKYIAVIGSGAALSGCLSSFPGITNNSEREAFENEVSGSWPTYGQDQLNRSYAPVSNGSDPSVAWSIELGETSKAQPIVQDGRIYATRQDELIALSAQDGSQLWTFSAPEKFPAGPTVYDGNVYIQGMYGLHSITSAGNERWSIELDSVVPTCPAVTDSVIYTSAVYETFTIIDRESKSISFQHQNNRDISFRSDPLFSAFALAEDLIVMNSSSDTYYVLDRSTMNIEFEFSPHLVASSPVVDGSRMYVVTGPDDHIFQLSLPDGRVRWNHITGGNSKTASADYSPAVGDGTVYLGSDGAVHAFDVINGQRKWTHETKGRSFTLVSIDQDLVYCGLHWEDQFDKESLVFALDRETGDRVWEIPTESTVVAKPTVVNNGVFVECYDGKLYAIEL